MSIRLIGPREHAIVVVAEAVCRYYDVTYLELRLHRTPTAIAARRMFSYLLHRRGHTLARIGEILDMSAESIRHYVRTAERVYGTTASDLAALQSRLLQIKEPDHVAR
jgi:hypothetical protein